jgi:sensor c-di-GMP phosphodiesterase-like protein
MSDVENRVTLIKKLREFGFSVAMDDYGKEHYSLSSLKDIPLDAVKIDMKCLKESEKDSKSREILKSVLDLAKQLDFKTITMGVETEEQLNSLTEMGTDLYQGYYFAKPMSVEDFEQEYMGMSAEDGSEFNELINNATAALEEEAKRIAEEVTAEEGAPEEAAEADDAGVEGAEGAEETPKE